MPPEEKKKAQAHERKRWLSTLLDRMTAPADVMRQHLGEEDQSPTLGSAAESGVRDLLRLVLPRRLAITSGFLRAPGRSLLASNLPGSLSPQTDVIVYDGLEAIPLHSIGGVDVVAAPDVLGVIEVKDTNKGSEELSTAEGAGGALEHTVSVSALAPNAFRGIVLFRGKGKEAKDDEEKSGEAKTPQEAGKNKGGRPAMSEVARATTRLAKAKLSLDRAPHVIYCASYTTIDSKEGSFLAFYDFRAQTVCVHEYVGDRTIALASFLRIITGFFAVQGLCSPSLHLDLLPSAPTSIERVQDTAPSFASLHKQLLDLRAMAAPPKPFYELLVKVLAQSGNATSHVVTGCDGNGLPTAGFAIRIDSTKVEADEAPVTVTAVAFFYMTGPNIFTCTDEGNDDGRPWIVEEPVNGYLDRALRDASRRETDNVAPGKSPEAAQAEQEEP